MADRPEKKPPVSEDEVDANRREFLRKSVYAAYATPLITALLVTESAAQESGPDIGDCVDLEWWNRCEGSYFGDGIFIRCLLRGCIR